MTRTVPRAGACALLLLVVFVAGAGVARQVALLARRVPGARVARVLLARTLALLVNVCAHLVHARPLRVLRRLGILIKGKLALGFGARLFRGVRVAVLELWALATFALVAFKVGLVPAAAARGVALEGRADCVAGELLALLPAHAVRPGAAVGRRALPFLLVLDARLRGGKLKDRIRKKDSAVS